MEHVLSNSVLEKQESVEKISSESNLNQAEVIEPKTETDIQLGDSIDETTSVADPEEIK